MAQSCCDGAQCLNLHRSFYSLHAQGVQGASCEVLSQKSQTHTGTVGVAIKMEHFGCCEPQAQELKSTGSS